MYKNIIGIKPYVKSPLNYIGGKYKILNRILPLFPDNIDTFVDLFGGGFVVGINANANKVIYNDVITPLCDLMKYFSNANGKEVIKKINKNIEKWKLSKTNKDGFLNLRKYYNENDYNTLEEKAIDFYTLICFSFNQQGRFNHSLEYNTAFGSIKSRFPKEDLLNYINRLNEVNYEVSNKSFLDFNYNNLDSNDFVYCDPPYLLTSAPYNDGNRGFSSYGEQEEIELLKLLDNLNNKNIRWALSNCLKANGKEEKIISEWCKKYNVHYIENKYYNYHRKLKDDVTEVIILNY